jgi:hypothetical protein
VLGLDLPPLRLFLFLSTSCKFDFRMKKSVMQVKNMKVEIIVMNTKAVVKNQCRIKNRRPKSEVFTLSTALVNATDALPNPISKELVANSALLKFSTTTIVRTCVGSQLQMTLTIGMYLMISFTHIMNEDLYSRCPILW